MSTQTPLNAAYNSRTADKFVVRLPQGMRDRLAEVSKDNVRSMNSEIVVRLESTFADGGADTGSIAGAGDHLAEASLLREVNKALALKARLLERMFNQLPETSNPVVEEWRAEVLELLGAQQSAVTPQSSL